MVGAGKAEGAMDAGNMLKPALARGELHLHRRHHAGRVPKYVGKDAALERRFQKVFVGEPSVEDTIAILRGLQERYEVHHGVEITDPPSSPRRRCRTATSPTALPDKAIDLMDEAAAHPHGDRPSPGGDGPRDRRLIQLKIQREALKKEKETKQRPGGPRKEIATLEREYNDPRRCGRPKRPRAGRHQDLGSNANRPGLELEAAQRRQDLRA